MSKEKIIYFGVSLVCCLMVMGMVLGCTTASSSSGTTTTSTTSADTTTTTTTSTTTSTSGDVDYDAVTDDLSQAVAGLGASNNTNTTGASNGGSGVGGVGGRIMEARALGVRAAGLGSVIDLAIAEPSWLNHEYTTTESYTWGDQSGTVYTAYFANGTQVEDMMYGVLQFADLMAMYDDFTCTATQGAYEGVGVNYLTMPFDELIGGRALETQNFTMSMTGEGEITFTSPEAGTFDMSMTMYMTMEVDLGLRALQESMPTMETSGVMGFGYQPSQEAYLRYYGNFTDLSFDENAESMNATCVVYIDETDNGVEDGTRVGTAEANENGMIIYLDNGATISPWF